MEEMHKARYVGRGAELQWSHWVHYCLSTSMFTPWKLSEPVEASSVTMIMESLAIDD